MVIESNLPLSVMDKFTKVVKIAFPDSEIASKFHCGRSKASCLVDLKESAAIHVVQLADRMKVGPFTVSTDESNDRGSTKLLSFHLCGLWSDVFSVPARGAYYRSLQPKG